MGPISSLAAESSGELLGSRAGRQGQAVSADGGSKKPQVCGKCLHMSQAGPLHRSEVQLYLPLLISKTPQET